MVQGKLLFLIPLLLIAAVCYGCTATRNDPKGAIEDQRIISSISVSNSRFGYCEAERRSNNELM